MVKRYLLWAALGFSLSIPSALAQPSLTDELVQDITTMEENLQHAPIGKELLKYLAKNLASDLVLNKDLTFSSKSLEKGKNPKVQLTNMEETIVTPFSILLYLGLRNGITDKDLTFSLEAPPPGMHQQEKAILLTLLILSNPTLLDDSGNPFNPVALFFSGRTVLKDGHEISPPPANAEKNKVIYRFLLCIHSEAFKFFNSLREKKALEKTLKDKEAIENFSQAVWDSLHQDLKRAIDAKDVINPHFVESIFKEIITPKAIQRNILKALVFHKNFFKYLEALKIEKTPGKIRKAFIKYMCSPHPIA